MSEMGNGIYITPDAGGTQLGIIFLRNYLSMLTIANFLHLAFLGLDIKYFDISNFD